MSTAVAIPPLVGLGQNIGISSAVIHPGIVRRISFLAVSGREGNATLLVTSRSVFRRKGSCHPDFLAKILRKIYYTASRVLTKNIPAFIIDSTSYYDTTDCDVRFRFYAFLFRTVAQWEGDKVEDWRFPNLLTDEGQELT
jgi:hypothetical protein